MSERYPPWVATYYSIRRRCIRKSTKAYKKYAYRGIEVLITKKELHHLWMRDKAFLMARPSIDRIDSLGNYEYANCRYVELSENSRNKRTNKLSLEIAREIRKRIQAGEMGRTLAREFKVSDSHISSIKRNQWWKESK